MKVLKVPFDLGIVEAEKKGARKGPDSVEKAAKEFFLSEDGKEINLEFSDVDVKENFDETQANITSAVAMALKKEKKVVLLGGDHSIAYGGMKAFSKYGGGIIVFDAHLDCMADFLPPSHEDITRAALKEGFGKEILIIGVRNFDKVELEFIEKNGNIKVVWMKDIRQNPDIVEQELRKFVEKFKDLYVSVDIDVLDPVAAPGTGWVEPAGVNLNQLLLWLKLVKEKTRILDVVEVNPEKDINAITAKSAAKIITEFSA